MGDTFPPPYVLGGVFMRRLIRKGKLPGGGSVLSFVPLHELDEVELKMDKCPVCKAREPLVHVMGFKRCPRCGRTYKLYDGKGYLVLRNGG